MKKTGIGVIYVDASARKGKGKIAVLDSANLKEPIVHEVSGASCSRINSLEFKAIKKAIKISPYDTTIIFSDSKTAIQKAEKEFKQNDNLMFRYIKGSKNPADKHTRLLKPKQLEIKKKSLKFKPIKERRLLRKYPWVQVKTKEGLIWMTQSKYRNYQKWLRKKECGKPHSLV